MRRTRIRSGGVRTAARVALVASLSLAVGVGVALAKGGTAKPPKTNGGGGNTLPPGTPQVTATIPPPPAVPAPIFRDPVGNQVGFDLTGFIQAATIDDTVCANPASPSQRGGWAVLNGQTIKIPCNTTLQFPAATYTWADWLTGFPKSLALPDTVALPTSTGDFYYPSTEISISGNIVLGEYIAGLVTISQQPLNQGSGFIVDIEYDTDGNSTGAMLISSSPNGTPRARIQINDPEGRFTRGQSPDERFSVDNENPTITAASGFPLCIPRTNTADDPLCPAKNRPRVNGSDGAGGCRNFQQAGIVSIAGWELSAPVAGQIFCNAFVMKAPNGTVRPTTGTSNLPNPPTVPLVQGATTTTQPTPVASDSEPDARQQVPFKIGDFINYTGTLLKGSANGPVNPVTGVASDTMSVHTIQANLGIFTQPGTLPAYLWVEETIVGADAVPVAGQAAVAPLEGQDRLVFIARTTDVVTPVDLYFIDYSPTTGAESNRWVTMEAMTGGITPGTQPFLGGVTTQLIGPQPGRVRLRANKAPVGVLVSPTRYVRAVARTLCAPATTTIGGTFWDINQAAPIAYQGSATVASGTITCLQRAETANGLFSGQYLAPVGEYIFPENVVAGDRLVPYNFWNLGFLRNGEGPTSSSPGTLDPTPW